MIYSNKNHRMCRVDPNCKGRAECVAIVPGFTPCIYNEPRNLSISTPGCKKYQIHWSIKFVPRSETEDISVKKWSDPKYDYRDEILCSTCDGYLDMGICRHCY